MNLISKTFPRYDRWTPDRPRTPALQDHDLPVLAKRLGDSHVSIDWESLIASGTPPALALGAERRWRGRR